MLIAEERYIDFHTHHLRGRKGVVEICSYHFTNSICTDKQFTVGQHPWYAKGLLSDIELERLTNLIQQSNCLAVGEIGLDKLQGVDFIKQQKILEQQLELATQLKKPVVIHCVHAWNEILQHKKKFPKIPAWCIHGFNKKARLANQLIEQDFYLSLRPSLKALLKYKALLKTIPLNRLFLETDNIRELQIESLYLQAAQALEISKAELQVNIINNAEIFFENG